MHRNSTSLRPRRTRVGAVLLLGFFLAPLMGCGGGDAAEEGEGPMEEALPVQLGPVDGQDLAPTDLERVAVGMMAPDFSLQTIDGDTLTLSSFRGKQNVLLVFYRGHW